MLGQLDRQSAKCANVSEIALKPVIKHKARSLEPTLMPSPSSFIATCVAHLRLYFCPIERNATTAMAIARTGRSWYVPATRVLVVAAFAWNSVQVALASQQVVFKAAAVVTVALQVLTGVVQAVIQAESLDANFVPDWPHDSSDAHLVVCVVAVHAVVAIVFPPHVRGFKSQHVDASHESASVEQLVVALAVLSLYPAGQVYAEHVALVVQQAVSLVASVAAVFFHAVALVVLPAASVPCL